LVEVVVEEVQEPQLLDMSVPVVGEVDCPWRI
jgi:hypothetical protein